MFKSEYTAGYVYLDGELAYHKPTAIVNKTEKVGRKMEQIKLSDHSTLLVNHTTVDSYVHHAIVELLGNVTDTIDRDSKLRKHYGVGTLFQYQSDLEIRSRLFDGLMQLDHHREINDQLLNREFTTLTGLKEVIDNCQKPVVVSLLNHDDRLFAVILNHLKYGEGSVVNYHFLAMQIEDDTQKVELGNPVCTLLNARVMNGNSTYRVKLSGELSVGDVLAVYYDGVLLGATTVDKIWLDGIENQNTDYCADLVRCVIALKNNFEHSDLKIGSTFYLIPKEQLSR